MRGDALYQVLRRLLDIAVWGGEVAGKDELPRSGPTVFVANHAGALGPIAVTASIPLRLYPWIVGDMLDRQLAGPYLERDFVRPVLHLHPRLAGQCAKRLSQITVRLLTYIECIPVWNGMRLLETFRLSVEYLSEGRNLLIFPEDPTQAPDEQTGMRPFKSGFAHLGAAYFEMTGQRLQFVPLAILARERVLCVRRTVVFNPLNAAAAERNRIARLVESDIRRMVSGTAEKGYHGVPLAR